LTAHLRPTAPIAADVLLVNDPGAALALAQELLEKPLMANHSYGLWGYSGRSIAGTELTVQSIGIGGPSAATVVAELAAHGARRAIRVGDAVALDPALATGNLVLGARALAEDGVSRALGVEAPRADPALSAALAQALGGRAEAVTVAGADLFHDPAAAARRAAWRQAGAAVADLETAAVLALGMRLAMPLACALVITETAAGEHDEGAAELALSGLATAAAQAFGAIAASGAQASEPETEPLAAPSRWESAAS